MENVGLTARPHDTTTFFSLINSPLKLRAYLLQNLPSAFFSGLKVVNAAPAECTVSVPYKWFTRNPFRSTYFACLSMGAELSTGVLAMAHVYRRRPAVSLLVIAIEAKFYKKATGTTFFSCTEGEQIAKAVEAALATNVAQEIRVEAVGTNAAGEAVATFWITWSFKAK